jgi:cellulose synthase/poly-beta-1,6-N-acetylglucosamine synthase-like glycosyltransferase
LAGATTDIQYFIHQGFTHFDGTYWVGANALIRRQALDDIAVRRTERGFPITVYVQDKTVIEDTESTIDLVTKGWSLYNYPARLAYSATPPDFGSLLIQRRRWANGGLLILPKLIRHLMSGSARIGFGEGFLRIHYLISLAATGFAILLLLLTPFEKGLDNIWLPLSLVPYFLFYGRDLVRAGYSWKDLLGVYALNLLLLPVHLGGVLRSLQQAITGRKASFGRTPKVRTRTTVPALYLWATIGLLIVCIVNAFVGFAVGEWARFTFSLMNAVAFIFVVLGFIGVREFAEDALPRRRQTLNTIVRFHPEADSSEESFVGIPLPGHVQPVRDSAVVTVNVSIEEAPPRPQ